MKRIISVFLSIILAFSVCITVNAQDDYEHEAAQDTSTQIRPEIPENMPLHKEYYYAVQGYAQEGGRETIIIAADINKPAPGDGLTVPDKLVGFHVAIIGDYAFAGADMAANLAIPETVHTIGKGAFENTDIRILDFYPEVTSIGENAFAGCEIEKVYFRGTQKQFESIDIGAGNDVLTESIEFTDKNVVVRRMFEKFAPGFFEKIGLFLLSPVITLLGAPASLLVFPPVALYALGAPVITAVSVLYSFKELFDLIHECIYEI